MEKWFRRSGDVLGRACSPAKMPKRKAICAGT
ncbi:MAG: hypothetical protein U1F34_08310 [Gammaproteobacteria bacterium]